MNLLNHVLSDVRIAKHTSPNHAFLVEQHLSLDFHVLRRDLGLFDFTRFEENFGFDHLCFCIDLVLFPFCGTFD